MNFILRDPQRTTYWKIMFAVSIGFLLMTIFLAFTNPSLMQIKSMQRIIVGSIVLSLSTILSTTSELLPVAWRKVTVTLVWQVW